MAQQQPTSQSGLEQTCLTRTAHAYLTASTENSDKCRRILRRLLKRTGKIYLTYRILDTALHVSVKPGYQSMDYAIPVLMYA